MVWESDVIKEFRSSRRLRPTIGLMHEHWPAPILFKTIFYHYDFECQFHFRLECQAHLVYYIYRVLCNNLDRA